MKTPWEIKIGKIALYIAVVSFVIGTILFIVEFTIDKIHLLNKPITTVGLYYVIIATSLNTVYILFLITNIIITKKHQLYLIKRGLLMLINIPIAILYFSILYVI